MKIALHTRYGDGIALAGKLKEEGFAVWLFIQAAPFRTMGDGMYEKAETLQQWENGIDKETDIVIFDSVGNGAYADDLKARGFAVWGAGALQDKLEIDRIFGIKFMQACGVSVPPTWQFDNEAAAVDFLNDFEGRYVYKQCAFSGSAKTHVGTDAGEMIQFIQKQKYTGKFILQKFIAGLELSTEVWFNANGDPVSPSNHTIETKKFMAGDVGVNTGSMSSLQWFHNALDSKAVQQGLGRCFAALKEAGYCGLLDINAIVNEQGYYFIENTARHGYGAVYALLHLFKMGYGETIIKLLKEGLTELDVERRLYGMTARLSLSPYPLESDKQTESEVNKLFKVMTGGEEIVMPKTCRAWLLDALMEGGRYYTAGLHGVVMELGTASATLEAGEAKIYDCIKNEISLGDVQYRIDSFDRAKKEIPLMAALGYETF